MKLRKTLSFVVAAAMLIACLSVGMVSANAETTYDWSVGTAVTGGKWINYKGTTAPQGNLIAGKQALNGISNKAFSDYKDDTVAANVSDNNLTTNIAAKVTSDGYADGEYVPFTFVLDDEYIVQQFLFGNIKDSLFAYRNPDFKIYASTEWETLYDESNLVIDATNVDNRVSLLKADNAKKARYVGFAVQHHTTLDDEDRGSRIRLSELGVYGEKVDAGYTSTVLNTENADLLDTLPDNLLDTSVAGGGGRYMDKNYTTGDEVYSSRGAATDGVMCYVNANISAGNAERWNEKTGLAPEDNSAYYFAMNDLQDYYIDLQSVKSIDTLLVGLAWTQGSFRKNLWMGRIYVSDSKDDLFSEENRVVTWDERGHIANANSPAGSYFTNTPAYIFHLDEAVEGRYIGYSLPPQAGNIICVPEIGAYKVDTTVEVVEGLGASVRNPDVDDNYALRFGFDLTATGIGYANEDPVAAGDYSRGTLDNAKIIIDDTSYSVVDFGAVVSIVSGGGLTLEKVDNSTTKKVPAEKLYAIADDGTVRYTAVVINIPADKKGTVIYARPYVTYKDAAGNVMVWYGEMISRSVTKTLENANVI